MADMVDVMIYARFFGGVSMLGFKPYSFCVPIACWLREKLYDEARRLGYRKGKRGRNFSRFLMELVKKYVVDMDCRRIAELDSKIVGSCNICIHISNVEDHQLIESIIKRCVNERILLPRSLVLRAAIASFAIEKGWVREDEHSNNVPDEAIEVCVYDECEVV